MRLSTIELGQNRNNQNTQFLSGNTIMFNYLPVCFRPRDEADVASIVNNTTLIVPYPFKGPT